MKALIVYDSVFGNTEKVAQGMGDALASQADVQTLRVGDIKREHLAELDVLIVGSPTRGFSPTPDTKNWLRALAPNSLKGVKVAAFDTRIEAETVNSAILSFMVKIFGYAAKPIGDRLVKKGGDLTLPLAGFFVDDSEGPLREGELERAAEWVLKLL